MGVVRLNYQQMDEIRKNKPIGTGKEGSCYFLDNNKIIKLYHSFFRHNKLYFVNLKDERIAFPIDIIYYENTNLMVGYTRPYLNGVNLVNGFPRELNLNSLKQAYNELKKLIEKYQNIYMDDMCLDNILYNPNNYFSLIDTSRWYPKENGYIESINDINLMFIASLFKNVDKEMFYEDNFFMELYNLYHQYEIEFDKRICGMKYDKINIECLFIECLKIIEQKISEIKEYKVEKIKDLQIK